MLVFIFSLLFTIPKKLSKQLFASMSQEVKKDGDYYLNYSTFLVEDLLFKLPKYMLENQSSVFSTMFTLPPVDGKHEGETDDLPIRLEGIKKVDFRLLLKVLYPKQFGVSLQLSEEEWLSVLALSTQWLMDDIRTLAIKKLYEMFQKSPHKLISSGKKCEIDDWVFIGVEVLVRRAKPLGEEDVAAIGVAEVLRLASIRESLRTERNAYDALVNGRGYIHRDKDIDGKIKAAYGLRSIPNEEVRRPCLI